MPFGKPEINKDFRSMLDELGVEWDMSVTPETYAWYRDEKNALDRLLEMKQEFDRLQLDNAKLRKLCDEMFRDLENADYELRSRLGRTFMVVTRYYERLQELGVWEA